MDIRTIERNARAIVKAAIKESDWYQDSIIERYFLGTVFSLTPSGKYYTPWANSNVSACPRCNGEGEKTIHYTKSITCKHCRGLGSREAYEDDCFNEALEQAAHKYNCWIESGDDPCDIFIVRAIKSEDNE